jgi:hypothetical protein
LGVIIQRTDQWRTTPGPRYFPIEYSTRSPDMIPIIAAMNVPAQLATPGLVLRITPAAISGMSSGIGRPRLASTRIPTSPG